jgi:MFS family permease
MQDRPAPPLTATIAIGAFFFVNGATYASWVPRLPEIRDDLGVSDTALGLTLLGGGVGGLAVSLVSGRVVDRVGSRIATITTSLVLSALLPLVGLAPVPAVLFATLLTIGAFDGLTDIAMNSQALQLQRSRPRSIMNRRHAVWSIGPLSGGLVAAWAAAAGVELRVQLLVTSAVLIGVTATASRSLLAREPPPAHLLDVDGNRRRAPMSALAGLFALGALAILAELPATEWASLLMAERFDLSVGAAGWGFIGFATGMVIGRLSADVAVDRFGPEHARRGGAAVAAVGLGVACAGPAPWVSVVGFVLAGAGASTLFPMLMRRGSELVPGAGGVAAASSGARLGILLGAPLMGLMSDLTSRSAALAIIGVTAAAATALLPSPRGVAAPDAVPAAAAVTPDR